MSARHSVSVDNGIAHLESFFPVEWDTEGRPVSYAAEATGTQSGETYFFIIRKDVAYGRADNGCDCPECAPHEQRGPLPANWSTPRGITSRCDGTNRNGRRCGTWISHPSGLCARHRSQAAG